MQWKWSSMSAAARDHPIPTTGREFLEPSRLGEPALDYALGELGAAFNQQTLEAFSDGAAIVDLSRPDLPLVYINTAFQRITGYTASEVLGQNCRFLQGTDDSQPEIFQLSKAIKARQDLITVLRNYRKDGTIFWNELRVRPLFNSEGEATHYLGVIRDVTAYRELNDRLERSACFDELTGLLTRSAFLARLAEIPGEIGLVVICCDTDQLRDVNGTHGRGTGDAVLQELGRRLQSAPDMVLASRLAAGQFAVALRVPEGSDGAAAIPHFQANALRPFAVLGATVLLTITVGWTRSTAGVLPNEGLLIQAETALYEAKAAGRGEIRAFNPATERESRRRLRITEDLRSALQHQEFVLHYQPKVDLLSGRIIGLEALLRWQHPAFGLQPPDRFMSVAEDSGLIVEIGAWVLTEACRFAVHLNRAGHAVYVAANVSPVQFQRDDVVALMRRVLKESGAEPGWIALELTETVIAGSNPRIAASFAELQRMGIGLAMDDFGTGSASLQSLRNLPFAEVKVDRSFVRNLDSDAVQAACVAAALGVARALGIAATCEGIETARERDHLVALGCPIAQGYFFSLPLESEDLLWLMNNHPVLPVEASTDSTKAQHVRS